MDQVIDLAENLNKLVKLLATVGETKWCKYVSDCRSRIVSGNYSGVEKLLRAFGGMGSLNDVYGGSEANDATLQTVRTRVYELADSINRSRAGT